ncbi:MAG: hypothetical protein L0Z70_03055 [Chloroflexi bacterium]|nr:hypothetical protein [Chloroflexota bacterium]
MKSKWMVTLAIFSVLIVTLACGGSAPTPPPVDTQATVNAGVAATEQAKAAMQATIDASVAATAAAAGPAPTPGPTVEYVTMTEEELEALINESVEDAVAATAETSSAAAQTTSDDTVTQEEVAYIYDYYYAAEEILLYTEELLYAYYDIYGELAEDALELLMIVEEDLSAATDSLAAIDESLQEISAALEQGVALAEETITQLETAAQEAQTKAAEAQAAALGWAEAAQGEREGRASAALAAVPESVPTDLRGSVQGAFDFIDAVNASLADNKLSLEELTNISALGANAAAGLQQFGGPQFQDFSGKINEITGQLARGQTPSALSGARDFEAALGDRANAMPGGFERKRR